MEVINTHFYPNRAQPSGVIKPVRVEKRWGYEKIFVNGQFYSTDKVNTYCMKEICIMPGWATSSHLHANKHETLFVSSGILQIMYKNAKDMDEIVTLEPGDAFTIAPGFIHKLICEGNEPVIIIEASTPDDPQDSIRVSL